MFSKVLVKFSGIVLIRDESEPDVTALTKEESVAEKSPEEQNSEEGAKATTVENKAAEEDGESH